MIDAIGHSIEIGDYVTAVWASGDVQLFEVVEFRNAGTVRRHGRLRQRHDEIGLCRAWKDGYTRAETQVKTVYKMPSQVTWVDKNYVMLHMLER